MNLEWGHARAVELLNGAATHVASPGPKGIAVWWVWEVAILATLARLEELRNSCLRHLRALPDRAFCSEVTPKKDRARLIHRDPPTLAEIDERFPLYDDRVQAHVGRFTDSKLIIAGKLEEAWAAARTDHDKECHLATCAVFGMFDRVLDLLDRGVFSGPSLFRTSTPLVAVCVESFRRDDLDLTRHALDRLHKRNQGGGTALAAGFLGRVPWAGYPYADW